MNDFENYLKLASDYNSAATLLTQAYNNKKIDLYSDETRPLYYLIGHSCECLLKAMYIKEFNKSPKRTHDLTALFKKLKNRISEEFARVLFWICNSHYIDDGEKKAHPNRYNDYKFSNAELEKRESALLKKQEENGFDKNKVLQIAHVPENERHKLQPELSSYCDYLFKSFQGKPEPKNAIKVINEEINKIRQN